MGWLVTGTFMIIGQRVYAQREHPLLENSDAT